MASPSYGEALKHYLNPAVVSLRFVSRARWALIALLAVFTVLVALDFAFYYGLPAFVWAPIIAGYLLIGSLFFAVETRESGYNRETQEWFAKFHGWIALGPGPIPEKNPDV